MPVHLSLVWPKVHKVRTEWNNSSSGAVAWSTAMGRYAVPINPKVKSVFAPVETSHADRTRRLAIYPDEVLRSPRNFRWYTRTHLVGHNVSPTLFLHVRPKQRGVDGLRHSAHVR